MKQKRISKSNLVIGMQCEKALWLKLHKPKVASSIDPGTQQRFEEGTQVGIEARKKFPKGYLVEKEYFQLDEAIADTKTAMKKGHKIIMEAAFATDTLLARPDIIQKKGNAWDLIEVKMGLSAKTEYIRDVAIQSHILSSAGIKIKSSSIMHLNRDCIYPDFSNLFETTDVTEEVSDMESDIKDSINELVIVSKSDEEPDVEVGDHCDEPYECAFKEYCWKGNQCADSNSYVSKEKPKINKKIIKEEFKDWEYPLYFFDFETIATAIPRFKGLSPYKGVPFQFSCHVKRTPKSKLEHFEYLHTENSDPRPKLISALLNGIGKKGSIVSYFKSFEIGEIKKLAEFDSKNRNQLLSLIDRFVDPLPIVREAVSHSNFANGFGLKVVAPTILGKKFDYSNFEIGDGGTAQSLANALIFGSLKKTEKEKIIKNLLEYCRQDTMAMVELVGWMAKR